MKMHEIILNSMKYPLLNLKSFFSLGFMILISSYLVSQYFDFNSYFENRLGVEGLLFIILLIILTVTLITILESGYTFKIIEKSLMFAEKPPEFNNFIHMFKHGFKEVIIGITYFLIPVLLFLIILSSVVIGLNLETPELSDEATLLFLILLLISGFVANVIFTVAIPHMAFKGGAFKEAFRFSEIFRKIRKIGLKRLLMGYLIVVLGVVVVGWPILNEIIESTNIIGFVIAELIVAPYILMFSARFTALLYRS